VLAVAHRNEHAAYERSCCEIEPPLRVSRRDLLRFLGSLRFGNGPQVQDRQVERCRRVNHLPWLSIYHLERGAPHRVPSDDVGQAALEGRDVECRRREPHREGFVVEGTLGRQMCQQPDAGLRVR
jgi:hypothetical protein